MRSILIVALALAGCDGATPGIDSGMDVEDSGGGGDGLEGTWVRDSNYGESSRLLTITLGADGVMSADEHFEVDAGSAATNGGCSSDITWEGTWSASGTTLTIAADSGTNTTTGCNDASMNAAARAVTTDEIGRFDVESAYTLAGDSLTFTAYFDPAPFTRQ
jgi:hypothetical protein